MPARYINNEADFLELLGRASAASSQVPGFLTEKERWILTLLACCPLAKGAVLEIGSYQGLSTVLLGTALRSTDDPVLHACDPFDIVPIADQRLQTDEAIFDAFSSNVERAGLSEHVVVHRVLSSELAKTWNKPLRFLWIDGDHSFEHTEADFEGFSGFLEPGGIIAFHDVLHHFPGPPQVFANRILLDEKWGACGLCGSIGWAQRARSREDALRHRELKLRLYKRVSSFACCAALGQEVIGLNELRYRTLRTMIPRSRPTFEQFKSLTGYKHDRGAN